MRAQKKPQKAKAGATSVLSDALALGLVHALEDAAMAAFAFVGRGQKNEADAAAVSAMRAVLNGLPMDARIVIGEGERDEAPMLYIGETLGTGKGPKIDIAVDPLEGTTLTAKGMGNALCVAALAPRGGLLHAPDVYMEKIAIGPGHKANLVKLDAKPQDNIAALAKSLGVPRAKITACILDRPRHEALIKGVLAAGARVHLISDGDIAGVMHTADPDSGIDIYMGTGGAPEGVLGASVLACIGGQMQTRLLLSSDAHKARARKMGRGDPKRIYTIADMVPGDVLFGAAGVTDGALLEGVRALPDGDYRISTLLMQRATGETRRIENRRHA